jgi:hypothetical protein
MCKARYTSDSELVAAMRRFTAGAVFALSLSGLICWLMPVWMAVSTACSCLLWGFAERRLIGPFSPYAKPFMGPRPLDQLSDEQRAILAYSARLHHEKWWLQWACAAGAAVWVLGLHPIPPEIPVEHVPVAGTTRPLEAIAICAAFYVLAGAVFGVMTTAGLVRCTQAWCLRKSLASGDCVNLGRVGGWRGGGR